MTETLKELFNAYKNLPVGVMFFKEEKLFFVNDHLHSVLLLSNLSSDSIVAVIGGMVGLEDPTHQSLCHYFSENNFFTYKNSILQIEHRHVDDMDIFVVIRINEQTIKTIDQTRSVRALRDENKEKPPSSSVNEHELLSRALGKWEYGDSFASLVLYKGIPIKGNCEIHMADHGVIEIIVEKKQLVAAHAGVLWLIGSKKDLMLSGIVTHYDIDTQTVRLEDLRLISEGFNRRSVIRYEAQENDLMHITVDGKKRVLSLHDVSEKGISVLTDDNILLSLLSAPKTLRADLILDGKKVEVKAVWLYNVKIESLSSMKAAFSIGYDLHNGALLREWLNTQQLRLIKEVRSFVQMISSRKENE